MPDVNHNSLALWLSAFPVPQREGHKYDRGHALIMGGAVMTGAARLAARAAQRMGAGLVTLAAPKAALPIYAEALESAIVREADTCDAWKELLTDPKRNAVLIGPGLGTGAIEAQKVLAALETKKPCVLDADALNNFADAPQTLFAKLHDQCVLTPHEGEFARLFGTAIDHDASESPSPSGGRGWGGGAVLGNPPPLSSPQGGRITPLENKIARARKAAEIAGCVVLLKGAETVIAAPDGQTIINTNAPPTLATGGSGDVLAGMILGLVAQRMPVFLAAAAAAWLHGEIATKFGPGLIAEDLVEGIPEALKELLK